MVYIVIRLFAIVFNTKRRRYTSFFYFDFQRSNALGRLFAQVVRGASQLDQGLEVDLGSLAVALTFKLCAVGGAFVDVADVAQIKVALCCDTTRKVATELVPSGAIAGESTLQQLVPVAILVSHPLRGELHALGIHPFSGLKFSLKE